MALCAHCILQPSSSEEQKSDQEKLELGPIGGTRYAAMKHGLVGLSCNVIGPTAAEPLTMQHGQVNSQNHSGACIKG